MEIPSKYYIMRCDLSGCLSSNGDVFLFEGVEKAEEAAKSYAGIVVPVKVAEKILYNDTRNKKYIEELLKININDGIKVKLSDYGRKLLLKKKLSILEDGEGYSRWQLWELFSVFGAHFKKSPFVGGEIPFLEMKLKK